MISYLSPSLLLCFIFDVMTQLELMLASWYEDSTVTRYHKYSNYYSLPLLLYLFCHAKLLSFKRFNLLYHSSFKSWRLLQLATWAKGQSKESSVVLNVSSNFLTVYIGTPINNKYYNKPQRWWRIKIKSMRMNVRHKAMHQGMIPILFFPPFWHMVWLFTLSSMVGHLFIFWRLWACWV